MIVQVIPSVSAAALLITENVVRHNIVPPEEALKIPASVTAPVPVPAGKVTTYATALAVTVVEVNAVLLPEIIV